jgi:hypothetical protein
LNSIEEAATWAAAHYAGTSTMESLVRCVRNFLSALHERGALEGSTAAQAFFVEATPLESEDDAFRLHFGVSLDRRADLIDSEIIVAPGAPVRFRKAAAAGLAHLPS